jgi:hypothetical protein
LPSGTGAKFFVMSKVGSDAAFGVSPVSVTSVVPKRKATSTVAKSWSLPSSTKCQAVSPEPAMSGQASPLAADSAVRPRCAAFR